MLAETLLAPVTVSIVQRFTSRCKLANNMRVDRPKLTISISNGWISPSIRDRLIPFYCTATPTRTLVRSTGNAPLLQKTMPLKVIFGSSRAAGQLMQPLVARADDLQKLMAAKGRSPAL